MIWITLEHILRVLIAGLGGAIIGYERSSRQKEAGIRTHFIVAVGSSLMMIISKYGFTDMGNWNNVSLDPSRVASQIVSGVGFLGAGTIFMNKQKVKGLTTAAGIWATAGVGMAIGAGMYTVGIGVTLLIVAVQFAMHRHRKPFAATRMPHRLTVRIINREGAISSILDVLDQHQVRVVSLHSEVEPSVHHHDISDTSYLLLQSSVQLDSTIQSKDIVPILQSIPDVQMVKIDE